jgi:hypothetical protein
MIVGQDVGKSYELRLPCGRACGLGGVDDSVREDREGHTNSLPFVVPTVKPIVIKVDHK